MNATEAMKQVVLDKYNQLDLLERKGIKQYSRGAYDITDTILTFIDVLHKMEYSYGSVVSFITDITSSDIGNMLKVKHHKMFEKHIEEVYHEI